MVFLAQPVSKQAEGHVQIEVNRFEDSDVVSDVDNTQKEGG